MAVRDAGRERLRRAERVGGCKGTPGREAPMSKGADTSGGGGCKNYGCVTSLRQGHMRRSPTPSSTIHAGSALMASAPGHDAPLRLRLQRLTFSCQEMSQRPAWGPHTLCPPLQDSSPAFTCFQSSPGPERSRLLAPLAQRAQRAQRDLAAATI